MILSLRPLAEKPPFRLLVRDPIAGLMASHPVVVAAVLFVTGWGSLLLIGWHTRTITTELLRSPGHMIGDFVLLPMAGALIATECRRNGAFASPATRRWAAGLATISTLVTTIYSVAFSGNYHGVWSVPHTLFIWLFAYIVIGYALHAAPQLRTAPRATFVGVAAAVAGHILIKAAGG